MAELRLALLGGFELQNASGEPVSLRSRKVRALQAYLAMNPSQPHARERLADLFWETGDSRTSLRQALTAVRKAIPENDVPLLIADGDSIALNAAAFIVDTNEFERLARDGTPEVLERAAELYRGDLLGNFTAGAHGFDDWLLAERMRLRDRAIDAFEALAGHYIDEGADEKAVRTANRLLALDPLQEGVHRTLMRLYVKRRQPNSALRQYRACREILERELGVPPEPETHRLYREILESRGREEPSQQAAAKRELTSIDSLASSPSPIADSAGLDSASATAAPAATPTRELRQATVMFADLESRFTQLSAELDFEELDELLQVYLATDRRHHRRAWRHHR